MSIKTTSSGWGAAFVSGWKGDWSMVKLWGCGTGTVHMQAWGVPSAFDMFMCVFSHQLMRELIQRGKCWLSLIHFS